MLIKNYYEMHLIQLLKQTAAYLHNLIILLNKNPKLKFDIWNLPKTYVKIV